MNKINGITRVWPMDQDVAQLKASGWRWCNSGRHMLDEIAIFLMPPTENCLAGMMHRETDLLREAYFMSKISEAELQLGYDKLLLDLISENGQEVGRQREAFVGANVPPRYLEAIDRPELKNPDAFDRVQTWEPRGTRPGLLVTGGTGMAKTRAVYNRLVDLHRRDGTTFMAFSSAQFKQRWLELAFKKGDDPDSSQGFSRDLLETDILFIDDLGQAKMTELYAEHLFSTVEARTSHARPIVVTVQCPEEELISKLAGHGGEYKDMAASVVRRLKECSLTVNFGSRVS